MNPQYIPQLVIWFVTVNVGALVVLAVLAYVSSTVILNWLQALDHRWSRAEAKRAAELAANKTDPGR